MECSVCGYTKDVVTATLTNATQYANALEFKNEQGEYYDNIEILFENGRGEIKNKAFQFKVTQNAAYKYSTASSSDLETIWTNENGKGVIYTKHDANSEWVRTEQETEFNDFASLVLGTGTTASSITNYKTSLSFTDLKYDKDNKVYYGTYLKSSVIYELELKFENGKLAKVNHTQINASSAVTKYSLRTLTYGNATIEIPTVATAE